LKKKVANPISQFGIAIKVALMEMCKTQEWLIKQLRDETGLFVDSSLMNKILVGTNKNPKFINGFKN